MSRKHRKQKPSLPPRKEETYAYRDLARLLKQAGVESSRSRPSGPVIYLVGTTSFTFPGSRMGDIAPRHLVQGVLACLNGAPKRPTIKELEEELVTLSA